MTETCWKKQYYDRKIGAVNLKPGDLVLVKADTFMGKRKIKDRWEEDTWEAVGQNMTDVPSYKVTNQQGKSCVLHQNWLLLIASEVGIPLYIGIHHAQDRCTNPTPCKTTSKGGETKMTPQQNNGKAVTQWPTSKASLGWINGNVMTSAVDVHWNIHKRWVKTLGNVMWLWTSDRTHTCGRGNNVNAPLMLADSEPQDGCKHSPKWVMVGKAKQEGGVKWVSSPCVQEEWQCLSTSLNRILLPTRRGTFTTHRGVASYLHWRWRKTKINQETRIDSQEHEDGLTKECGDSWITPKVSPRHWVE